jgi:transporter family protein
MTWLHWALLSAAFAGLTAALAKLGVRDIDSNLATAVRTTVVLVLVWTIVAARGLFARLPLALSFQPLLFLTLSGLATGASWLCYFKALQLGRASQVAPVDKLSIIVAMALAALFLGETLTWKQWVGGALMIGGAVLVIRP